MKPSRPPPDWKRIEQGDGFAIFLPPSCERDPQGRQFVHGGESWRCGSVGVDLVWGMWGTDSFTGREGRQCRTSVAGVPAFVSVSVGQEKRRRLVWYLTGHVHEPIVSAWSSAPADEPLLEAITTSGVLGGERGPNR